VRRNAAPPKNAAFPLSRLRWEGARSGLELAIRTLDVASLVFAAVITYGVLAVVFTFYYSTQRTYPGFRDWLLLALAQAVGLLMLMAYPAGRPAAPAWILLTNFVLVYSTDRLHRGMARLAGAPGRFTRAEQGGYALALGVFSWFLLVDYQTSARMAVVAACMSYAAARTGAVALQLSRGRYRSAGRYLLLVQAAGIVINLARAGVALGAVEPPEYLSRGGAEAILLGLLTGYGIATLLGLLLLTAQRTQLELAEAQAQVRRLEGIIPICMYCKKVRNDQEAWDRIETYISNHSEARFSHGICPDCLPRQFPPELLEDQAR
jgi:hypothetical protein